jgi:sec-independent protein translocase protein TatB
MFDIGGWEFLIIAVIGILVIGPKDLPAALRTARIYIRRARELAAEFRSGIDEVVREAELDEVKNEIKSAIDIDDLTEIGETVKGELAGELDLEGELQSALEFDHDNEPADEPRILDHRDAPPAAIASDGETAPESADPPADDPPADDPPAGDPPAGDPVDDEGAGVKSGPAVGP